MAQKRTKESGNTIIEAKGGWMRGLLKKRMGKRSVKNSKKTRKLREAEKQNKVIRRKESVRKEKGKHKMKMGKCISKEYTKPRDNKKFIK